MKIAVLTTDNRQPFRQYDKPEPFFGTAPEALLQGFEQTPGVEIHVVSCIRKPVKSPVQLAPKIYFHSVVVPKLGWMRTLYQGCVRATRNKLREIQPDIVHGQGTELDCGISAVFSGFPNVLTIHGNMRLIAKVNQVRPFSFNWLAAKLEAFTLPRTDGVVCITNYTRAAVSGLAKQTWILPNAVDRGFFDIEAKPEAGGVPVGICVGAICHRKNQNNFIRALDGLARERKFKMVFLGQMDDGPYCREFLDLIKIRPWCEFAGFAGREETRDFFRIATFAVLPTLEDNCPMVILEAMASGVPVLASKVGGIPDLIEDNVTGLFCNPMRPESFAEGVNLLLNDSSRSRQLAVAAKTAALVRFHPAVVARRHLEIYRQVLGQGQTA
jgi:glycosyltransferase involved in cell wall biosynthesis